ncbi:uncharacterized protein TrAtP1_000878 [Trichoderma atroviride]|uniref:uncharacterized protein n=1 Tax=Hypocrea atroviridis TaxID=63577 RepID=UPI003323BD10|nr:hypothetical protein TrAtP1_000878 [Trichoderma atroviride]
MTHKLDQSQFAQRKGVWNTKVKSTVLADRAQQICCKILAASTHPQSLAFVAPVARNRCPRHRAATLRISERQHSPMLHWPSAIVLWEASSFAVPANHRQCRSTD